MKREVLEVEEVGFTRRFGEQKNRPEKRELSVVFVNIYRYVYSRDRVECREKAIDVYAICRVQRPQAAAQRLDACHRKRKRALDFRCLQDSTALTRTARAPRTVHPFKRVRGLLAPNLSETPPKGVAFSRI